MSEQSPDWFKQENTHQNIKKEETITLFSRLSGWIYVSGDSRNRKHRLGKSTNLPSEESKNVQNVSSLAPNWMQREKFGGDTKSKFKNFNPPNILRQEQKRMILVDDQAPEKSIFSIGDFRHDIRTREEVDTYNQGALAQPKRFLDWKEDPSKQGYDKQITEKIGTRKSS